MLMIGQVCGIGMLLRIAIYILVVLEVLISIDHIFRVRVVQLKLFSTFKRLFSATLCFEFLRKGMLFVDSHDLLRAFLLFKDFEFELFILSKLNI